MDQIGTEAAVVLGISQVAYLVAMATLGIRLALLARRTRQLPEALLAVHFLASCTIGYVLQGSGHAIALEPDASPALFGPILAVGHLASVIGVGSVLVFNYRVFRRGTRLGVALLAIGAALLVGGYVGYAATGGFSHGRANGFPYWVLYAGFTATSVWTLVEPLAYFAALRRRARLGLADPVVANRFLLWGIGSAARFGMLVIGLIGMLSLTGDASDIAAFAAPTFLASGAAGLAVATSYWLAFFPPRPYRAWIARRAASVAH
jgi:hypothetical protein